MEKILPVEQIDHHTQTRPFAVYSIDIPREEDCALYMHCHEEAELFLLRSGSVSFRVEEETFRMKAGDCIFVPPMMIHGAFKSTQETASFKAVVFAPEVIASYSPAFEFRGRTHRTGVLARCGEDRFATWFTALSLIPDAEEITLRTNELTIVGALLIIWQELYNYVFAGHETEFGMREEITRAIDYIKKHFADNIQLSDLASTAGFSEGYFGHVFTQEMGVSPFGYLTRVRIANATNLLTASTISITEIATKSGFDNISYFNRTFRRMVGMTPREYRLRGRTQ